jgi:predicted SnoaL-like aldol condensation-catalyzing enzyme
MDKEHPNIKVLKRLDLANLSASAEVIAEYFVWHYINPELPEVQGDYVGLKGFQTFFETIGKRMKGTFKVNPVSIIPIGDEFVVVHVIDTMVMENRPMELDAVVVWRIVDGKVTEAWDIPGINTVREVSDDAKN